MKYRGVAFRFLSAAVITSWCICGTVDAVSIGLVSQLSSAISLSVGLDQMLASGSMADSGPNVVGTINTEGFATLLVSKASASATLTKQELLAHLDKTRQRLLLPSTAVAAEDAADSTNQRALVDLQFDLAFMGFARNLSTYQELAVAFSAGRGGKAHWLMLQSQPVGDDLYSVVSTSAQLSFVLSSGFLVERHVWSKSGIWGSRSSATTALRRLDPRGLTDRDVATLQQLLRLFDEPVCTTAAGTAL